MGVVVRRSHGTALLPVALLLLSGMHPCGCSSAGASASPVPVWLWQCQPDAPDPTSRWAVHADGSLRAERNNQTLCLDVAWGDTSNRAKVVATPCREPTLSPSQRWALRPGPVPHQRLVVGHASGRCLNVMDSRTLSGNPLQLWDCKESPEELWAWSPGSGSLVSALVVPNTSFCLDAGNTATPPAPPIPLPPAECDRTLPYCNTTVPFATRVADLLARMAATEKISLLSGHGVERLSVPGLAFSECLHGVSTGCGVPGSIDSTGCPTSFPTGPMLGTLLATSYQTLAMQCAIAHWSRKASRAMH
jgi:hypothetical protein